MRSWSTGFQYGPTISRLSQLPLEVETRSQRLYLYIFEIYQLNGTTANIARPNQKLVIQDDGHYTGSCHNFAPIQDSAISTVVSLSWCILRKYGYTYHWAIWGGCQIFLTFSIWTLI